MNDVDDQESKTLRAHLSVMQKNRRFLWKWLGTSAAASALGNIGHVWQEAEKMAQTAANTANSTEVAFTTSVNLSSVSLWIAMLWALVPPLMLMLAVHGLPVLQQMLGRDRNDRVLQIVVWGVTAGAFLWSGFGIFSFTVGVGVPAAVAWLAPVVIDLSVFGATRGLVQTAPVTARLEEGIIEPMHNAVEQADQGESPEPLTHGVLDEATLEQLMVRFMEQREVNHDAHVTRPVVQPVRQREAPRAAAVKQPALELTHDAGKVAGLILAETTINQPLDVMTRTLELAAQSRLSQRKIAEALAVEFPKIETPSSSTVGRIISAARELEPEANGEPTEGSDELEPETETSEPVLAAV